MAFALIIDGKSLAYALEDGIKSMFLDLAIGCASVICCRSSPKQKALVCFTSSFSCLHKDDKSIFILLSCSDSRTNLF